MQSKPDDLTLLKLFKRSGVEPIKIAKYACHVETRPTDLTHLQ